MLKKKNLWRGLTMVFALLLAVSMMAGNILELYRTSVDAFLGTRSTQTVTEQSDDESDAWTYKSEFTTAKEAYEGFKDFAIEASQETFALLKNENGALPLAKDAKITMLGVRSYAPVYGNSGGSVPDGKSTVQIFDAFTERGFQLNPETLAAYEAFFADKEWTKPQFGGGILPAYAEISAYNDPCELTMDELKALNPDFQSKYTEYGDAAIVVVSRVGGEGGAYYPGEEGLAEGVHTVNGNILSLSDEEMAMIEEAKANFDKVIVLVNAANPMEISNLEEDPDIDAILWVGYPGAYGFYGVADVLNGTVAPSAHLGDTFVKNGALAPAMQNFGNIPWANASDFAEGTSVNSYLIENEGIYTGYRYYETRYADIVLGNASRRALPRHLAAFFQSGRRIVDIGEHDARLEPLEIDDFQGRTRAFVKIQDGCNRFCSYCIIPYARGRVRSKPPEDVAHELRALAARGFREVVLVGINLTAYGQEWGLSIADAVETACSVEGIERVRLGSLEPDALSEEVVRRLAAQPRLCPQFHLALQSGCDATLRRMNRHYDTAAYRRIAGRLREAFPGCALTTDVMVGFPGEDEEEFAQSLAFVEAVGFSPIPAAPVRRPPRPRASCPPPSRRNAAAG